MNDVRPASLPAVGQRGSAVGDVAHVVSVGQGFPYLGGRTIAIRVLGRDELLQPWKSDGENSCEASEWIVGDGEPGIDEATSALGTGSEESLP